MRVPVDWLREHCSPDLTTDAIAERLAMTGTEVDRVVHHGVRELGAFVVGRVLEAQQHPEADRLTVCRVDVGEGEAAQIVCGAPNVAAGQTVAVARPGAVMPDGTKLGQAKLRGVVSDGMILAEDELAIGTEHAGILVLDGDAPAPGTPLEQVLPIATDVLELEITPNRPDCLGIYGVARELHAATGAALSPPPWADDPGSAGDVAGVEVVVEAPDLCPRFTGRVFEDVRIGPSPPWLKARLMAAGQRPISNVVDITNYAMLLTGHPLHAFDLERVAGARLVVRRARDGEKVETLDGTIRELDSEMLVIEDAEGPTSIAGVMGGARSEVGEGTTRVLMEVANWVGPNIHRTSLRLNLRSEASARFEKQLQPEQALDAQALATRLMVELCGARLVPGTIDVGGPGPEPPTVRLRDARVSGLLGLEIPRERSAEILRALEFDVAEAEDGLDVRPPAFRRGDVTREADVIEEVARLHGLEKIPATLPARRQAIGGLSHEQKLRRKAADVLAARGLHEVVGWSFHAPDLADRLRLPADHALRELAVPLANPMSEEQALLRTTVLGSLLDNAARNVARGMPDVRIFEAGPVYRRRGEEGDPPLDERRHLGVLVTGPSGPSTWRTKHEAPADFFAAKGILEALLDALRVEWGVATSREPFLHPGRAADVLVGDTTPVGWLGELHPLVLREWDLQHAVGFEIDLGRAIERAVGVPAFSEVPAFPAVHQDLAVVVAEEVPAQELLALAHEVAGPVLESAEVFDVYRGEQVGEGKVSLALALRFRAADRTLTEDEASAARERIASTLAERLGATVRA